MAKFRIKPLVCAATALVMLGTSAALPSSASAGKAYSIGGEFYAPNYDDIKEAAYCFTKLGKTSYYTAKPTYAYLNNRTKMNSDILYFSAHGGPTGLSFNAGSLWMSRGSSNGTDCVGLASLSFSNTQLIIFDACSTAKPISNEKNLCETAVARGADCVLGWKKDITTDSLLWLKKFYYYLRKDHTVAQSVKYADSFTYTDTSLKEHTLFGNKNIKPNGVTDEVAVMSLPETDNRGCATTPIIATREGLNLESLYQAIAAVNPHFDARDFTYRISETNGSGTDYVVDLFYCVNGCRTSSGYTFLFENNRCDMFYDNMTVEGESSENAVASFNAQTVNAAAAPQTVDNAAILRLARESLEEGMVVTEQSGEMIYDLAEQGYVYRVTTTYHAPGSQACAVATYCYRF